MRVLVVGGGGREHALCWALRRDASDTVVFAAPGNPGTASLASNLPISATAIDDLVAAVQQHDIDITIVGPEAPLAAGLVDRLRDGGRAVFGPTAAAARLESSKAYAKEVMRRAGVRTAASATFVGMGPALEYIGDHAEPLVVKASGLAAGKGAVVCQTRSGAAHVVRAMLDGSLGDAGREVLVAVLREVAAQGSPYEGVLYAGLMILPDGTPSVLEFNARFGDPETQALLPALLPGFTEHLIAIARRRWNPLPTQQVLMTERAAVTTVLAARGYPDNPEKGVAIGLPDAAELGDDVIVFHAGTSRDHEGRLRTSGGRVLSVTGLGTTVARAATASRAAAERIAFEGKTWRRDVAWREIQRAGTA
ncbi:MAG: phosphoribosylamine--glycine ligase [Gemmatimonadetes bacterium]|nr:MAG: phosphoribosylamine--glycine ligase [Gemmatimonadota bacterium]